MFAQPHVLWFVIGLLLAVILLLVVRCVTVTKLFYQQNKKVIEIDRISRELRVISALETTEVLTASTILGNELYRFNDELDLLPVQTKAWADRNRNKISEALQKYGVRLEEIRSAREAAKSA